jgi:hypothetical protein
MPDDVLKKNHDLPDDQKKITETDNQDHKLVEETDIQEDIINKNEENNNMEVPHTHKQHGNENKKVKGYIYEFFMLFLAVTAGFFVENWREYIVERHREKQYIESLIRDIKNDTTSLGTLITDIKIQVRGIDTLLRVMENPKEEKIIQKIYFYKNIYTNTCSTHNPTDRTISQLKNAGGLRLIVNKSVSDSIVAYDELNKDINISTDFNLKFFYDFTNKQKEIFEIKVFRLTKVNFHDINSILKLKKLMILTDNPHWMDYYYNDVIYFGMLTQGYNDKLISLKTKATNLLKFLKKEYDIK